MIPITKLTLPSWQEIEKDFKEVLESGRLTMGSMLRRFELEAKKYLDAMNCVSTSSATLGLTIALKAMELKGSVIVPSFTYIATINSIIWAGLKPKFVDIDPKTFNIDPELIEKSIDSETSAIVPVHVYGNPCDIKRILEISKDKNIPVIWDCAHSFGSKYHLRRIGGFNHVEVFSFAPTKLVTTGEGGLITAIDKELAEKVRALTRQGLPQNIDFQSDERLFFHYPGTNSRMSEVNAVLGLHTLKTVEDNVIQRRELVKLYIKELENIDGVKFQEKADDRCKSAHFAFPIIIDREKFGMNRDELQAHLEKQGIGAKKLWFWPIVSKQPAYEKYNSIKLPHSEYVSENQLCLPLWSHMKEEEAMQVCDAIKKIKER